MRVAPGYVMDYIYEFFKTDYYTRGVTLGVSTYDLKITEPYLLNRGLLGLSFDMDGDLVVNIRLVVNTDFYLNSIIDPSKLYAHDIHSIVIILDSIGRQSVEEKHLVFPYHMGPSAINVMLDGFMVDIYDFDEMCPVLDKFVNCKFSIDDRVRLDALEQIVNESNHYSIKDLYTSVYISNFPTSFTNEARTQYLVDLFNNYERLLTCCKLQNISAFKCSNTINMRELPYSQFSEVFLVNLIKGHVTSMMGWKWRKPHIEVCLEVCDDKYNKLHKNLRNYVKSSLHYNDIQVLNMV